MSDSPAAVLFDANGNAIAVQDDTAIPANTPGILFSGETFEGKSKRVQVLEDGQVRVSSSPPKPPPGTTEYVFAQDDANLSIGPVPSTHDTISAVIGNGVKLYLQIMTIGAAGDPSEKGSKVEFFWVTGSTPVEHLIERLYATGASLSLQLPDVHKARDGTAMVGDGANTKLIIRRTRLSTSNGEIDASLRGYTESA